MVQRGNGNRAWSHQRQILCRTLNSTARVAYRAYVSVNSVSILILKHRHGLVTDCHWLPIVPIVPQSDCECCRCIGQALQLVYCSSLIHSCCFSVFWVYTLHLKQVLRMRWRSWKLFYLRSRWSLHLKNPMSVSVLVCFVVTAWYFKDAGVFSIYSQHSQRCSR